MAGTITNIINTIFRTDGADRTERDTNRVGRAQTRLGQASASAGREFSAQASGLGGLVAAYAGTAATVFALQSAFDALARSARAAQTLEGLKNLATASGESSETLLANVREITKNQLSLTEAAQQINLSLSAGFDQSQIEGLADVALKASRALGRDLTDAYTRVIRGSAKLETELLDELGIYTKIDPATRAYAAAIGKSRLELTEFERRQAFVNSVIEEGQRKFSAINTTIPTSAEKIEAFGTKIVDVGTQLGILLADAVAPLADFLTNNFAGSLSAVAALLTVVARTAVNIASTAIQSLGDRIAATSARISDSIIKNVGDFRNLSGAAQTAAQSLNIQTRGINRAQQAELRTIRELSQERKLNSAELTRGISILETRRTNLKQTRLETIASIRAEQQRIRALSASGASTTAANAELARLQARLASTTTLLRATTTQINAFSAALGTASVRLAAFAAGLVTIGGAALRGILAAGTALISLASGILGLVAIVGLVGSAIASAAGKQEEFNALLAKGKALLTGFFNPDGIRSTEQAFVDLAATSLKSFEKVDSQLREIDEFKIKSKILGVDVELSKTKEDLVKEVGDALEDVAKDAAPRFSEAFLQSAESNIGATIGAVLGGAVGSVIPAVGTTLGVIAGTAAGSALGAAFAGSELETVTTERARELSTILGDPSLKIDLVNNEQLSKAVNILDQQLGVAADLSLEGRKYLKTQIELARSLQNSFSNIVQIQIAAEALGLSASQIQEKFAVLADDLGNAIILDREFGISITIQNEQALLSRLDTIKNRILNLPSITSKSDQERRKGIGPKDPDIPLAREALEARARFLDSAQLSRQDLEDLVDVTINFASVNQAVNKELLLSTNLLKDFSDSADRGALSLESITQKQRSLQKTVRRASELYTEALLEQENIAKRISSYEGIELDPDTASIVASLRKEFADQAKEVENVAKALENLRGGSEDFFSNILGPLKTQLEIEKQITDNFKQQLSFKTDQIGLFKQSGELAITELDREVARIEFLNKTRQDGIGALQERNNFESTARAIAKDNLYLQQELVSLVGSTGRKRLEDLKASGDLTDEQKTQIDQLTQFTNILGENGAAYVALADNAELATQAALGSIIEFIQKVNDETIQLKVESDQALEEIKKLETKEILLKARFEFDLAELQRDAAIAAQEQVIKRLELGKELTEAREGSGKITAIESATEVNRLELAILDERRNLLDLEIAQNIERFGQQQDLLRQELEIEQNSIRQQAEIQKVDIQARVELLKGQIEGYKGLLKGLTETNQANVDSQTQLFNDFGTSLAGLFTSVVSGFASAANVISTAATDAANVALKPGAARGRAAVATTTPISFNAIAAPILASAKALASETVPTPGGMVKIPGAFEKAISGLDTQLKETNATIDKLTKKRLEATQTAYDRESELLLENAYNRQQQLLSERENLLTNREIQEETNAARLADAAGAGGGAGSGTEQELSEQAERLKSIYLSVFDGVQSAIETSLTGVKDYILYGEGNLREVFVNLLRSIGDTILEQGFIKPLSENLTGTLFGAVTGIEGGRAGIEEAFKRDGSSVDKALYVTSAAGPLASIIGGAPTGDDAAAQSAEGGGFFSTIFGSIKSGFTKLFGEGGILSTLLSNFGGFVSNIFGGILKFVGSIFGLGFASGGLVHRAGGGAIPQLASGGGLRDRVPALLEPGEFVLRRAAANKIGMSNLQQMNATGQTGGGAPVINIVNEGTAKTAEASQPRFDGEKYVIDVITRDLQNNGPIRRSLRGGL